MASPCKEYKAIGGDAECYTTSNVARENNRRFEIKTKNTNVYCRIKIDGCVIKSQEKNKCDYVFVKSDSKHFLFVELKGSDVEHAIKQIRETVKFFDEKLSCRKENMYAYIVSSGIPSGANTKFNKLKDKFYSEYKIIIKKTTHQAIISESEFCKS